MMFSQEINVWGLHGAKILEEMKIDSTVIYLFLFYAFSKKIQLYIIFNQFQFFEMGKILKLLTKDNQ